MAELPRRKPLPRAERPRRINPGKTLFSFNESQKMKPIYDATKLQQTPLLPPVAFPPPGTPFVPDEMPDIIDFSHIQINAERNGYSCIVCGAICAPQPPIDFDAFLKTYKEFMDRHAFCNKPIEQTVYQVFFRSEHEKMTGQEYHLWQTTGVKVAGLHIWGHKTRRDALQWIVNLSKESRNEDILIRPLRVRVQIIAGKAEETTFAQAEEEFYPNEHDRIAKTDI